MANKLSPHQQAILDILEVNGGWMRRREIAHQLAKETLSLEDVTHLDLLEGAGLVIKEISDDKSPQGEVVRYRVAEPKADLHTRGE